MRTGHKSRRHHRNDERKENQINGDVAGSRKVNRREQMNDENSQQAFKNEQAGGVGQIVNEIEQHLHEPFVVDPGMPLGGIGKGIDVLYPALLPDVLPKADMAP